MAAIQSDGLTPGKVRLAAEFDLTKYKIASDLGIVASTLGKAVRPFSKMPKMSGLQLALAVRAFLPKLPILLATGYAELPV